MHRESMGVGWRSRVGGWLRRYLAAEVTGLGGAITSAVAVAAWTRGNVTAVSIGATLGETVGFYAAFTVIRLTAGGSGRWWRRIPRTLGGLLVEFGPAEVADTLLIRPSAMFGAAMLLGNLYAGVIAGKLVADVAFYLLAIAAYELVLRRREPAPPGVRHTEATALADKAESGVARVGDATATS